MRPIIPIKRKTFVDYVAFLRKELGVSVIWEDGGRSNIRRYKDSPRLNHDSLKFYRDYAGRFKDRYSNEWPGRDPIWYVTDREK